MPDATCRGCGRFAFYRVVGSELEFCGREDCLKGLVKERNFARYYPSRSSGWTPGEASRYHAMAYVDEAEFEMWRGI